MTAKEGGGDALVQRHYRRNAAAFVGEATLFGIGLLFASTTTVLPGFVSELSGSAVLVGLVISLSEGAWRLPQLLLANWIGPKPRKKRYLTGVGMVVRPVYLAYAVALVLGVWRYPVLALTVFFVLHTLMYAGLGVDTLVWWDVLAKTVPERRRGRVLGASTVLRGLIAVAGGALISLLLSESGPGFPTGYTVSLAVAGGFFMLSLASWLLVVEPAETSTAPRPPWRAYFRDVAEVLRSDGALRRLLWVRVLAGASGFALGFYILFGIDVLGLPREMIGVFAAVQTVGGILSGILFGWLSERCGNHRVIQIATAVSLGSPAVALLFTMWPQALWGPLYALVFAAIGAAQNANFIGFANLNVELAPQGKRTTYIGLFNTLSGLVVIWPAIGGWVLERTSYVFLFAATLLALSAAHALSWWLSSGRTRAPGSVAGLPPLP